MKIYVKLLLMLNVIVFEAWSKPPFFVPRPCGALALFTGAETGDFLLVESALEEGVDINCALFDLKLRGYTPLMLASGKCSINNINIVRLLLERNAEINRTSSYGDTALLLASHSIWPSDKVIRLLLQAGADVNHADRSRKTAFDYAEKREDSVIVLPILKEAQSIQDPIDFEINYGLGENPGGDLEIETLQKINTLPIESPEFQMILNYILNRIKIEQERTEFLSLKRISRVRIMLITIADRLASIYAKYVDKVIKDVLSKTLQDVLELPFDLQIEILKQQGLQEMLVDSLKLRLKRKLPFTNFDTQIQLKDGRIVTFGLLILQEIVKRLPLSVSKI